MKKATIEFEFPRDHDSFTMFLKSAMYQEALKDIVSIFDGFQRAENKKPGSITGQKVLDAIEAALGKYSITKEDI